MRVLASRDTRSLLTWILAAAALVTLLVAFQQQYRAGIKLQFNDFDRWMAMTPAFVHGHGSYVNDDLPTPPLSLLVLAPFSALSRPIAQFLWVCLKLPLACLVFLLSTAIVARSGTRLSATALALIVAGWWLPVVVDMQEGQMNFLALLPLVAGLYVAQRETAEADIAAGWLIGLGAAVKVTPVIFIAYFLWKRRWRVALAAVSSLAVCSLVVPALFFGWDQNLRWLGQWMQVMIVPYAVSGKVVYATTQSVGSFALRLLSPLPAFEVHRTGAFEYGYMNLAALSGSAVHQVVRAVMLAVAIAGLVWTRHPLPTLRSQRYVLEIGAVAAFMLWFSERTWVHHYVSFVLTLSAAGMVLSDAAVPEPRRLLLKRLLIFFSIATVFASEAGRLFGSHGVEWAKAVGVFLWPSVLVTMAALSAPVRDAKDGKHGEDNEDRRAPAVRVGWVEAPSLAAAARRFGLLAAIVFLAGSVVSAQAPGGKDPFIGTWKLNRAKSTFSPGPAPLSRTMKFEPAGDGIRHVIETFVNNGSGTDEGVHLTQYAAHFDGKDNTIQGSALDTVSLRRINARRVERTGKVGGQAVETQTWTLSADGKTLTVTTQGSNDGADYSRVEMFDRQ